jgi:hypothetical protein
VSGGMPRLGLGAPWCTHEPVFLDKCAGGGLGGESGGAGVRFWMGWGCGLLPWSRDIPAVKSGVGRRVTLRHMGRSH